VEAVASVRATQCDVYGRAASPVAHAVTRTAAAPYFTLLPRRAAAPSSSSRVRSASEAVIAGAAPFTHHHAVGETTVLVRPPVAHPFARRCARRRARSTRRHPHPGVLVDPGEPDERKRTAARRPVLPGLWASAAIVGWPECPHVERLPIAAGSGVVLVEPGSPSGRPGTARAGRSTRPAQARACTPARPAPTARPDH